MSGYIQGQKNASMPGDFYVKSGEIELITWLIYSIEGWKKHVRVL